MFISKKIATSFGLADDSTILDYPFPKPTDDILEKNKDQASKEDIKFFQSFIGSINYTVISTRRDISKYSNTLAEFMQNPSSNQILLATKLVSYLYSTRYPPIEYSDSPSESEMDIASDASFADDPETRYSSQGYVILLFGGPIAWSAKRQKTITTSSTEAELLAFTFTAKELISTLRLFDRISLKLDICVIQCDNKQTIRLITADIPKIRTALKHVDIHSCWSRQEYKKGSFSVGYTPTNEMIADGFTKLLRRQRFIQFRDQLNLQDLSFLIKNNMDLNSDSDQ